MSVAPAETETVNPILTLDSSGQSGAMAKPVVANTIDWEIIQRGDTGDTYTKLTDLYTTVDPEEILKALEKICENITTQGRRTDDDFKKDKLNDVKKKTELNLILTVLKSVCTATKLSDGKTVVRKAGESFSVPTPAQHIHRSQRNVIGTQQKDPQVVKVDAKWKFDGYPAAALTKDSNNAVYRQNYYWALTDLLGLFFTKLGPAPSGANEKTFFLPLIAVYARWTKRLMDPAITRISPAELAKFKGFDNKSESDTSLTEPANAPGMFQCTWIDPPLDGSGKLASFALGASSGGFNSQLNTRRFGINLRVARWELFDKITSLRNVVQTMDFQDPKSPGKIVKLEVKWGFSNPTPAGWKFGNCAETYPFLQLLVGRSDPEKLRTKGFALKPVPVEYNAGNAKTLPYDEGKLLATSITTWHDKSKHTVHKWITPPCNNCQFMLRQLGGKSPSFEPATRFAVPVPSGK